MQFTLIFGVLDAHKPEHLDESKLKPAGCFPTLFAEFWKSCVFKMCDYVDRSRVKTCTVRSVCFVCFCIISLATMFELGGTIATPLNAARLLVFPVFKIDEQVTDSSDSVDLRYIPVCSVSAT